MTTAELLTITPDPGLDGETAPALARFLEGQGLPLRGRRLVAAEESVVEQALGQAIAAGGLVVCVGEGDGAEVVRQALARLLGSRLVLSERALDALVAAYADRGLAMPRRAEGLALIPQGTTVLIGAAGGEPGVLAEPSGAQVVVLPASAPRAIALLQEHVLPRLPRRDTEPGTVVRTLRLVGLDLGTVEGGLTAALRGAEGVAARATEVGGEVWIRLRVRGPATAAAEARLRGLEPALRAAFGAAWYGQDEETLEDMVGRLLRAHGLTIALAESCTGGLVGHRLTQVAGSSAYFERGLVVYSNAAKQTLLGVPERVLTQHGAVSAECAEAMARGARSQAGTDLGLSVTGIAGPEGGSPAKPIGTVFIGLADSRGAVSHHYRFDRDRDGNKALAATMALDLIRRYCLASCR